MVACAVFSIRCSVFRKAKAVAKSSRLLPGSVKDVFFLFVFLNTEPWILRTAQAKSLGIHGIIYVIEEQDPIILIQQKLKLMEDSGELKQRNLELQKNTRTSVERPKPVEGITKARKGRVFTYDPTYVVQTDLYDHQGKIFAKKGAKLNPLKTVNLCQNLIFFDGDDEEQLGWIKEKFSAHLNAQFAAKDKTNRPLKLILTKGAPLQLSEELNMSVYFDQNGALIKKLGIKHVPAIVSQEGLHLKIKEIKLPPSREPKIEGGL